MKLTFTVSKNPDKNAKEELVFLISNRTDKAAQVAYIYRVRWKIEHCFKQLKSNGFNLEEMNFKNPLKVMLMMAITVFLYVLCIVEGLKELKKSKPSDLKIYAGNKCYLTISVFSKGLSYLCSKFKNLSTFFDYLHDKLLDINLLFVQNVQ